MQNVGADDEVVRRSNRAQVGERPLANVSLRTETLDRVVARVDPRVMRARTQNAQMREPRAFAAADIENAFDGTAKKIFGRRHRNRDLAAHFSAIVDAMRAAAVPLVEVFAVVAFCQITSASG